MYSTFLMLCFLTVVLVIEKTPAKPTKANLPRNRSFGTFQREFHMGDAIEFCVNGVEVGREVYFLYALFDYLFVHHIYCGDEGCFKNVLIYSRTKF